MTKKVVPRRRKRVAQIQDLELRERESPNQDLDEGKQNVMNSQTSQKQTFQ